MPTRILSPKLRFKSYDEIDDATVDILLRVLSTAQTKLSHAIDELGERQDNSNIGIEVKVLNALVATFDLEGIKGLHQRVAAIEKIETVLKTTLKGLSDDLTIENLPKTDWLKNRAKYEELSKKAQHALGNGTALERIGLLGYVRGAIPLVAGNIHIAFGYLFDEDLSTWTLIHEATHKFCGTSDHGYYGEKGFDELSPSKRLDNADSFALFVMSL
jgi:hypothetical protein